jgi:hypothetical protein
MSNVTIYQDSINRLAAEADAIGRLAQDEGAFAGVFAAFEAQDADAFRWVLGRLDMLPHCELICEWVRIKLCVLRCVELCGPPLEEAETPNLGAFARAIVHLASHERMLERLVEAVSCGDARAYRTVVAELNLEPFCHLLCRYVCGVIYRRVCDIVCAPVFVAQPDPISDVRADAQVLARLIADDAALDTVTRSAEILDGDAVKSVVAGIGFDGDCEIICRLICTWRCVWVTRLFCRQPSPVLTGAYAVEEARDFARALRPLAVQPRALGTLVAAIELRDTKSYEGIVRRFGLGPYCEQLSTWVCSLVCGEFCFRICPPQGLLPDFFKIGGLDFQTQIDSALPATGLTVGGTQAFYGSLRLNGVLTQTLGGQPMEYTFEYLPVALASTTLAGAAAPTDTVLSVASSAGFPTSGAFNVSLGGAVGGYEIVTVTSVSGTTWTVLRGQQGTAALPAAAGAAIVSGVAAAGSWTQIPQAWIERTVIAYEETVVGFPIPHIDINYFTINGNPAVETVIGFTPDGWIPVPQGTNIALTNDMIVLNSTALAAFAANDETGVAAATAANPLMPTDLYFGLRMRVRQQGSTTDSDGGTCGVIAVDNVLYNNIDRHPEWAGGVISGQYGVAMLDIKELQGTGNGCKGITDSLSVLFTASHPNLGPVSLSMVGGLSGPYGFTLPTPLPQTGNWYGTAINNFNVADLEPCAYLVTLNVSLLLTTGDTDFPNPLVDQFAFCAS